MHRKILFVVALALGMFFGAQGQQIQDIRFGVQASPQVSWMFTNDNQITTGSRNFGLKLGLVGEYNFAENYALTSGIGISFNPGGGLVHEIGGDLLHRSDLSRENLNDLDDGAEIDYRLQYVEIPFGLKMRTRQFGYIRYFAHLPVFNLGILTRARADIMADNASSSNENVSRDTRFFNFSWGFGGGMEYSLSTETAAVVGLYYQQSMVDVTRDQGEKRDGTREDSKGSFGNIALHLGILF